MWEGKDLITHEFGWGQFEWATWSFICSYVFFQASQWELVVFVWVVLAFWETYFLVCLWWFLADGLEIYCYIIKEWFFYINHFSLIIFYLSVWLGFELFRSRAQVYSQLEQFTLARKRYDNHHCHNKPPDRKWDWSMDDVMPGRDGPENLRILKKSQLRVEIGPWRQKVEFLP